MMSDPFYYQAINNLEAQIEELQSQIRVLEAEVEEYDAQVRARDYVIAQNFHDAVKMFAALRPQPKVILSFGEDQ